MLSEIFKSAWLGQDIFSKSIFPAGSQIPVVHSSDVASLIQNLSNGEEEQVYHLAVENESVTYFYFGQNSSCLVATKKKRSKVIACVRCRTEL